MPNGTGNIQLTPMRMMQGVCDPVLFALYKSLIKTS